MGKLKVPVFVCYRCGKEFPTEGLGLRCLWSHEGRVFGSPPDNEDR